MKAKPIPDGYHTITPYLAVQHVKPTIEWLKNAFDAKTLSVHEGPTGEVMNAEVKVGSSIIMLGEKSEGQKTWPAMLYMYVEDVDSVFKSAIKAGAKLVMEPIDHFYGDRSGAVQDPSGNEWWIAMRKENLTAEEIANRALS